MNNDTPGTVDQAAGLTGLPFALVVVGIVALVAVALLYAKKKRYAKATLLVGGALLLAYLVWSNWLVLLLALIVLAVGAIAGLSVFARLRRAGAAALRAVREPVGDDSTPAAPPAATE